ncbi:MAG: SGNH/GDSL hydrolase family protein [Clostridia bacterium]|nr:SGNH/GDSL hydrolase family protein [Clostridia bacterium]
MRKEIKITIFAVVSLIIVAVLLHLCSLVLRPKYMSQPLEGALIAEYYGEVDKGRQHQVLFVGDCEVYESFVPPLLWEEYGITSYIRGSAQQLIWQSYYLLEETFRYESPKVVVFNVLSMKYGEPQKEEYNRMTLDGMRNSPVKHQAILASMTKEENIASYYFPILRYHSRWKDLTAEDFKFMFKRDTVSHNGYLMQTGIRPMEKSFAEQEAEAINKIYDPDLPATAFEYLDKMKELCKQNGAELILIKTPTNSSTYWWYDEWDAQIAGYAEQNGLDYYNFIENEAIGIDWQTDTYDRGLHLNVYGAEKLTKHFGELLVSEYGLESQQSDVGVSSVWKTKTEQYYKQKEEMERGQ